jgi:5'-deoxynucleotidase YfbR-like HD superfamily hydrolase
MTRVLNYQGKLINPLDLKMSDLKNIGMQSAITLSRINRFWGQTREAYSVAQHVLSMVEEAQTNNLDEDIVLWCLLHETYEALTGMDIPSPIKHSESMRDYREAENKCLELVAHKYSIEKYEDVTIMKTLDKGAMLMEAEALMPYNNEVNWRGASNIEPYGKLYKLGASEKEIREDFISKWYELLGTLTDIKNVCPFGDCFLKIISYSLLVGLIIRIFTFSLLYL